jgi:hypothetical protein
LAQPLQVGQKLYDAELDPLDFFLPGLLSVTRTTYFGSPYFFR